MRCHNHNLAVVDPFRAIRSEFSKQLGVPTASSQGVRIVTKGDEVVLSVDLPGVSPESIDVAAEDGTLTITGTRSVQVPEEGRTLFDGIQTGEFQRTFRLDESLDIDSIDAVMDLGVLTLTIPKRAELQPRKITVRTRQSN